MWNHFVYAIGSESYIGDRMYEFQSRVRYSESDFKGQLNLHGVLDYFQDCTTLQSEEIGIGVETMHSKNLVWVMSTWQIDVLKFPKISDRISIGTFPYDFKGFFGYRNFLMKDEKGEVIAMGDSMWTLLNYAESKPVRVTDEILKAYKMEPKYPMDYVKGKIQVPKELEEREPVKIVMHHLDANMHVNNGQYVTIGLDQLEDKDYRRLRVEYRKMARLGDVLIPYVAKNDNGDVVVLKDKNGDVYTVLEMSK